LITVKRKDFEALNDVSLIWTCIEPTIQQIRGKNFVVKSEAYASLNPGQRALLMFQVLYGHSSNGIEEFYLHLSYLLSNKEVWSQLKNAMRYFKDYDMAQILEKMDIVFQSLTAEEFNENAEQHNVLITSVNKNAELSESISILNKSLSETLPLSIKLVASYIRDNVDEFVQLID
jgi:BMFP domain-containing protein YqiC